ncbi:MAG: CHC2 zinc finger domain-containing protein [Candidatus Paceibacterota bacterium]
MDPQIEEIKSRLDIVELVGQYIKLRKTGANFSARCPFHNEKSGSFFVSPTRQTWRCFGCQKGGDIFTFVQEIEGLEFGDALRILAAKAGVELKKLSRQMVELKTERERLYDVCELATKFFEKQLAASVAGKEVQKYLLGRGLSPESVSKWRIGYSPDSWQGLHDFLASEGYTDNEIIAAGLAGSSSGGRTYDRFRGRIMFPIFDFNSQVVGFGGRIFESKSKGEVKPAAAKGFGEAKPASTQGFGEAKEAKYLNTTNTLLYDKSRILYGLDRAKVAVRRQNSCVLVEGYTDVIMSSQAGVENVAASSGTALTPFQLKILKRFTDNIILGYDMDLAGDTANRRGIDLALAQGFNVSVARPPFEGKDPADVIALDPQEWCKAVENTQTIMEFYFDRAFSIGDKATPQGRKKIVDYVLPVIKVIPNAVEQAFWLQKMADRLEVRDIHYEEYLREELKKVKLNEYVSGSDREAASPARPRQQRLEERILALVVKFPKTADFISPEVVGFFSAPARAIIEAIKASSDYSGQGIEGEAKDFYEAVFMEAESETIDERAAKEEVEFHAERIKKTLFKKSLAKLSCEMLDAEKRQDHESARRLGENFNSLSISAAKDGQKPEK